MIKLLSSKVALLLSLKYGDIIGSQKLIILYILFIISDLVGGCTVRKFRQNSKIIDLLLLFKQDLF